MLRKIQSNRILAVCFYLIYFKSHSFSLYSFCYTRFLTRPISFSIEPLYKRCRNPFNVCDSTLLCGDIMRINKGAIAGRHGGIRRMINQAESELVAEDLLHKALATLHISPSCCICVPVLGQRFAKRILYPSPSRCLPLLRGAFLFSPPAIQQELNRHCRAQTSNETVLGLISLQTRISMRTTTMEEVDVIEF